MEPIFSSRTWAWRRSSTDRRFFVGLHLESSTMQHLVTDDYGRLVLV